MDAILAEQGESMRCIFVDTALNENTEWRACRDLERDDRPVVIDSLRWRHGKCEQGSFLDYFSSPSARVCQGIDVKALLVRLLFVMVNGQGPGRQEV